MRKTKPTPLMSKNEALRILSEQMRKPDLAPNVLARLTNVYAKLSGWKPKAQPEPEEKSLDQQIIELERKRKQQAQQ